jgi:hypothetical protein
MMLKTIDILIGLSVVMLLVSMIVTVITQVITTILNQRGKHLMRGISDLLSQIDPDMPPEIADEIAKGVLSHPLVRNADGRLGDIIHREELTKLLLELGAGDGPQTLTPEALAGPQKALVKNGVCKPEDAPNIKAKISETLKNVRSFALQLELSHPELTNAARARIAMLQQADNQLLAKINLWFDQTMDRVAAPFTGATRYVTFAAGLVIALLLQLDTAALVSRLSADQSLRESLVKQAVELEKASPPAPGTGAPAPMKVTDLSQGDKQAIRDLMLNNIVGVPQGFEDWKNRWTADNWAMKSIGILLTALLLSLGAPFWYNALQNLIRLRSVFASKDDQQRDQRQLSPPTATAASVITAADPETGYVMTDERGDLTAVA